MPESQYIQTSHTEEAINSLEFLESILSLVSKDIYNYKWCIYAAHNACQALMVLYVKESNGLGAFIEKDKKEFSDCIEKNKPFPSREEFLAPFRELYNRAINKNNKANINNHKEYLEKLNQLRNGFMHFKHDGASIKSSGIPTILLHSVEFSEALLNEFDVRCFFEESEVDKTLLLIEIIKKKLGLIQLRTPENEIP